jgi:hypothetical protein
MSNTPLWWLPLTVNRSIPGPSISRSLATGSGPWVRVIVPVKPGRNTILFERSGLALAVLIA